MQRAPAIRDHWQVSEPRLAQPLLCGIPRLSAAQAASPPSLDPAAAARFAGLALTCLHREYPNKIAHTMESDADALPPHVLTPAFYGCFDWHSDVHGHWLLVRLVRLYPNAPFAAQARAPSCPVASTPANISTEVAHLTRNDRAEFERPYGLAWLLQLASELRQWQDPQARQWLTTVAAARDCRRRAPEELAAQAPLSHPHRRA